MLLGPPDARFYECLPLVRRALLELPPIEARHWLAGFCDHAAAEPEPEFAAHHARTFNGRRRTLHLLDHADGDGRWRRRVRARIAAAYAVCGRRVSGDERPDHLAVVLEFAARTAPGRGERLLERLRPGLERLRSALAEHSTPYSAVLDAVCATLPPPDSVLDRRTVADAQAAANASETRHVTAVPRQAPAPEAPPARSGAGARSGAAEA